MRLVWIGKIFAFCRIDGAAAEWFRRRVLVEIFGQKKLTRFGIAHENALLIVGLRILEIRHQVGIARGRLFGEIAAETVNKIICVDRIAVGPASRVAQMKSKLG